MKSYALLLFKPFVDRAKTMKLSRNDLRILMLIRKEDRPMPNYEIAKNLGINPAQSWKRLQLLENERVLHAIAGYPKFYTFNGRNIVQDLIIFTIECPKCQMPHVIHHSQTTVQCDCLTNSGKKTRFYVYPSRIKDMRHLCRNNQKEEELTLTKSSNPFQ